MRPVELQRSYEAMTLWDEYMAASIAGYVRADRRAGAGVGGAANRGTERMVVLAGTGHVQGRVGMPDRFTRRTGLSTFTVVPLEATRKAGVGAPSAGARALDAEQLAHARALCGGGERKGRWMCVCVCM